MKYNYIVKRLKITSEPRSDMDELLLLCKTEKNVKQKKRYDAEAFLSFLKNVLIQYPQGKIVMILDNAKIHHAKLLHDFLEENKVRLELVFLPHTVQTSTK